MATSSPSAIIRSLSSTRRVTASRPNSGPATSTVRTGGTRSSFPSLIGPARGQPVVVRADAAFALPALYEALERRGVRYAIRLPANDVLERSIEDLVTRPRGRPSYAPLVRYRSFAYQAASWDRPRRVIAKIEHHLGELFPRVGFIVTTLTGTNRAVVRFYNQRGTARRAKPPSIGRASPVTASGPTRSASCSGSSPTASAICCAGWSCPSPSRVGR